jgi:hypothetical protein
MAWLAAFVDVGVFVVTVEADVVVCAVAEVIVEVLWAGDDFESKTPAARATRTAKTTHAMTRTRVKRRRRRSLTCFCARRRCSLIPGGAEM